MPRHTDPLVSFDVPRNWEDRTIVAFAAPAEEGRSSPANLVMTRDRLRDDEDLPTYADRHVGELGKQLDGFTLYGAEEAEVDGRAAIAVSFTSGKGERMLGQRMTMVQLSNRRVVAFTMTSPREELEQMTPLFERIMSSVTFASEEQA